MIPYQAGLQFFQMFFDMLPLPFRAFFVLFLALPIIVHFVIWFVAEVLG